MFQVIGRGKIPKTIEIGVLGSFKVGFWSGSRWLNEDSLRIRMIMPIRSLFQDNESNNVRYFAWLADGNDAVSWMCI